MAGGDDMYVDVGCRVEVEVPGEGGGTWRLDLEKGKIGEGGRAGVGRFVDRHRCCLELCWLGHYVCSTVFEAAMWMSLLYRGLCMSISAIYSCKVASKE
jgi:hypothetical protein